MSMTDEEKIELYKKRKSKNSTSDKEYELAKNEEFTKSQQEILEQNYINQKNELSSAQSLAEQSASISNEKLMKYLDQYQRASGLAVGQRGSAYIQASNNYANTRADIAKTYTDKQADLLNAYTSQKLTNEQNNYSKEIDILDKYRQKELEDEALERERIQWKAQMDAYNQDRAWEAEDRDYQKNYVEDSYWYSSATNRIDQMIAKLSDKDGNLSESSKRAILKELDSYKDKFSDKAFTNKLLDYYKTQTY